MHFPSFCTYVRVLIKFWINRHSRSTQNVYSKNLSTFFWKTGEIEWNSTFLHIFDVTFCISTRISLRPQQLRVFVLCWCVRECVCVCVFVSVWRYTLATRRRGTTAMWRINIKKAVSLALTRKLHMAFLVSLLVGYTMRDIRYKWNEGPNSVGVSNEVSLPQFKVLGHRQRAMEISLTTGISCKCHPHTLTEDISCGFVTHSFKTNVSY